MRSMMIPSLICGCRQKCQIYMDSRVKTSRLGLFMSIICIWLGIQLVLLSRVPTPPAKSSNVCVKFPGPGKSWKRNIVWDSVGFLFRVPTPPAKSWNVCKISKTWKVMENDFGPGKSQNLPGNDADAKIIS